MTGFQKIMGRRLGSLAALLLLVASMVTGCAPSRPRGPQANEVLDSETVVMLDTGATTQLSRQKEWVETKNGFLEPHIILRNRGGKMLKLEIRTYFKDEYGATIKTQTDTWDPVSINPREDFHYHKLCPNKSGIGYQFHIRMATLEH